MFSELFLHLKRKWNHNPFLMADAVNEEENLVLRGWPKKEAHRIAMESYYAVVDAKNQFLMIDCQKDKLCMIDEGVPPKKAYALAMAEYHRIMGG